MSVLPRLFLVGSQKHYFYANNALERVTGNDPAIQVWKTRMYP